MIVKMGWAIDASIVDAVEKIRRCVATTFIGSTRRLQDAQPRFDRVGFTTVTVVRESSETSTHRDSFLFQSNYRPLLFALKTVVIAPRRFRNTLANLYGATC